MSNKRGPNIMLDLLMILILILLVLLIAPGCASSTSSCRCTSDTECMEKCGGYGDPTPRS